MSIIRQDATTKDWVIVAPSRGRRPHDAEPSPTGRFPVPWEASCPFCPGNESRTPPEVLRLPDASGSGWAVRVFPNKFGALNHTGTPERREDGPLFRDMAGVGQHEVIVETPLHNRPLPLMTDTEVERVLTAYRARYHYCDLVQAEVQAMNEVDEHGKAITDDTLLVLMNAQSETVDFMLPDAHPGTRWDGLVDTATAGDASSEQPYVAGAQVRLIGRSLQIFRSLA